MTDGSFKLAATAYDEGYKKGAEEMREICATAAGCPGFCPAPQELDEWRQSLAEAIRALPVEPDE